MAEPAISTASPCSTLPDVTLCCVDTANHALALRALARSRDGVRFARALLLTDALPPGIAAPSGIDVVPIAPIASRDAYSDFVLKSLLPHVATLARAARAMGRLRDQSGGVGSGIPRVRLHRREVVLVRRRHARGQRRILAALAAIARSAAGLRGSQRVDAEDTTIGRTFRPLLEREHGIRFGNEAAGRPLLVRSRLSDRQAVRLSRSLQFLPHRAAGRDRRTRRRILRCDRALAAAPAAAAQLQRARPMEGRRRDRPRASSSRPRTTRKCAALLRGGRAACRGGRSRPAATIPAPAAAARVKHVTGAGHGSLSARQCAAPTAESRQRWCAPRMTLHRQGEHRSRPSAATARCSRPRRSIRSRCTISAWSCTSATGSTMRSRCSSAPRSRSPQEPEFHNNLGLALAAADRNDEAIAAYRRTLDAQARSRGGMEQPGARPARGASSARGRSRRFARPSPASPTSRRRIGISRSRCSRSGDFRARLARVRVARIDSRARQARERRLSRARAGTASSARA